MDSINKNQPEDNHEDLLGAAAIEKLTQEYCEAVWPDFKVPAIAPPPIASPGPSTSLGVGGAGAGGAGDQSWLLVVGLAGFGILAAAAVAIWQRTRGRRTGC